MKKFLAIILLLTVFGTSKSFAGSTTATANVNLSINASFSVNNIRTAIIMGNVVTPGAVTVDPQTAGNNAAAFSLTGPISTPITISWPATVTITNGTDNLTVTPSVTGNTANNQVASTVLTNPSAGVVTSATVSNPCYYFWVGAGTTVPSPLPSSGAYSGSVTVTITY